MEPSLPKIDDMMARVAEKRRGEEEGSKGKSGRESSDKENSQSSENSESPRKNAKSKVGEKTKAVVGKTYGKKGLTMRSTREDDDEEQGTSKKKVLGQNTISRKPPAVTKQV